MSESLKRAVRTAVLRLLGPLVKLLLDAGIGVGEFTAMAKMAYVRAARLQAEGNGRMPSATRIAVVTGLTRKEVAAILAAGEAETAGSDRGRQRAERVLTGWWNDSDFHDEIGHPAALSERGGRRSFAALCERYSGDPRFVAILEELLRVRAVRRRRDGRIEAVSRTYATVRWDPDGVAALGEELADHCSTLLHNLEHPSRPHLVRRIANARLDARYVPMLIRDLEERALVMTDSMDDALNHPQYTVMPGENREARRLGLGVYLFEEPSTQEPPREGASRSAGRRSVKEPAGRPARKA